MQREKPPEWREKQKGSRGIRRGQRYRLVFQFPIRQANQLINLCERLGLVEKVKGMGSAKAGTQQYRFIKNDFYNYLADAFKA